ncbi:transposase [Burkholderia ubonensis]|uniref:transposase n=1 Tax=Burkholderia ubonensis TaxID=101571 RepID=UPI0012FC607E
MTITSCCIGIGSAWTLNKESFGRNRFQNRHEVADCLGLEPKALHRRSGTDETEQGISKAGNQRPSWLILELAWC